MTGKILIVLAVLVVLGAVTETSAHPLAIMDLADPEAAEGQDAIEAGEMRGFFDMTSQKKVLMVVNVCVSQFKYEGDYLGIYRSPPLYYKGKQELEIEKLRYRGRRRRPHAAAPPYADAFYAPPPPKNLISYSFNIATPRRAADAAEKSPKTGAAAAENLSASTSATLLSVSQELCLC
ncbi:hypothetical protein Fcan01_25085 [Folsomia candida]|uniref:Uncharacterized protein n=1 Tax=Folsomia candida TaxID=158441 RepID=A0A226D5U9_FOLCA|nr:hypothetical protein Fcan01_25085 [Folsomia candida]